MAIADVLFGAYNPGGRTPATWYNATTDLPPLSKMDMYADNGADGITYRYALDMLKEQQLPK